MKNLGGRRPSWRDVVHVWVQVPTAMLCGLAVEVESRQSHTPNVRALEPAGEKFEMPDDQASVPRAVMHAACRELDSAMHKIRHCVDQLTNEDVWWRPDDGMNSIANLLLHLAGNVRQWIISGIGGKPDTRRRHEEFESRDSIDKAQLLQMLHSTVEAAQQILQTVPGEELCRRRRIQGFDVTGAEAVFDSIAHFRGHTQEIVHMTRCLRTAEYRFDFVPQTAEQGRP